MSEQFVTRKRRRKQNIVVLGLLAFAALSLGGWFTWQNRKAGHVPQDALAKVVSQEGSFRIKRDNKQQAGSGDLLIMAGDKLQTRPGSSLEIEYLDGSARLSMSGGTIVLFEDLAPGKKFRLLSGRVGLEVQELPEQGAIEAETSNAVAKVREPGRFSLQFQGLRTVFEVQRGKLHVRRIRDGFETMLSLGDTLCCEPEKDQARIEFQDDLDL